MRVAVYFPDGDKWCRDRAVLAAFAKGLKRHGVRVRRLSLDSPKISDVAVIKGWRKDNHGVGRARTALIDKHIRKGGRLLVIDQGFVGGRVPRSQQFSAGWDELKGRANFCNEDVPSDRWDALGVTIRPMSETGTYALVCGQVHTDAAVWDIDMHEWAWEMQGRCEALGLPVRHRPHPKEAKKAGRTLADLRADLGGARLVVTCNSNVGVDAVISGRPVVATDRGSMVWDLAARFPGDVCETDPGSIELWAHRLAYAQWTTREFASGAAWDHLRVGL